MTTHTDQREPNYRIYESTGTEVFLDIFAESLDAAIERGRAWMLNGEFGDLGGVLGCEVRKLVHVKTNENGCYDRYTGVRYSPNVDGYLATAGGGLLCHGVGQVDDDATLAGERHDCLPLMTPEHPDDCKKDKGGEHNWQSPRFLFSGIRKIPGRWGIDHDHLKSLDCCAHCGVYRTVDYGATDSESGKKMGRITFEDADKESEDWAREQRRK